MGDLEVPMVLSNLGLFCKHGDLFEASAMAPFGCLRFVGDVAMAEAMKESSTPLGVL